MEARNASFTDVRYLKAGALRHIWKACNPLWRKLRRKKRGVVPFNRARSYFPGFAQTEELVAGTTRLTGDLLHERWLPLLRALFFLSSYRTFSAHLLPHESCSYMFAVGLQDSLSVDAPEKVEHESNQARPPGLVARSKTSSIVAVEVLVEQYEIAPMRIFLELLRPSV